MSFRPASRSVILDAFDRIPEPDSWLSNNFSTSTFNPADPNKMNRADPWEALLLRSVISFRQFRDFIGKVLCIQTPAGLCPICHHLRILGIGKKIASAPASLLKSFSSIRMAPPLSTRPRAFACCSDCSSQWHKNEGLPLQKYLPTKTTRSADHQLRLSHSPWQVDKNG